MTVTFPEEAYAVRPTCTIGKHICCWSYNSTTKHEWKAFAITLFPFQVALLAFVKNDLIIAW